MSTTDQARRRGTLLLAGSPEMGWGWGQGPLEELSACSLGRVCVCERTQDSGSNCIQL